MNPDQCTEQMDEGLQCSLDAGHDGPHIVEGEIPPSIGRMVGSLMEQAEEEARRARAARIRLERETYRFRLAVIVLALAALADLAGQIARWTTGG
ncbi:hypothetical protein QDA02_gp40 [Microbacterium phage Margaery]|uniref:Uncharacterized protein n=1 Tax=Microbacterium phage Margaery TaxID=2591217 RepID=A0A514DHQ0_9CAUD|nr:hypothetical protein QDA02_gp40 [Microbacterium phage Margaery]QDH93125.1 hypothetical protein PBI_MARGAERY_68 [Microbacterium phage Margaery]